jgi:hypothetical protein
VKFLKFIHQGFGVYRYSSWSVDRNNLKVFKGQDYFFWTDLRIKFDNIWSFENTYCSKTNKILRQLNISMLNLNFQFLVRFYLFINQILLPKLKNDDFFHFICV